MTMAWVALFGALASAGHTWPWWDGYGWPWALLWLVFAVLFWGGLIALLVWAVRSASAPRRGPDTAMQVLKRRLASGEITQEEYERIRRLLED
jgi:putative membrane protein